MKLDLGTQFHAKHVYNLQPNYIQCNVQTLKITVQRYFNVTSGFWIFVTYTCFDDDTSILLQIFCLINCFLCLLTFPASYSNIGNISLIEGCMH